MEAIRRNPFDWITFFWNNATARKKFDDLVRVIDVVIIAIFLVEPPSESKDLKIGHFQAIRVDVLKKKASITGFFTSSKQLAAYEKDYNGEISGLRRDSVVPLDDFRVALCMAWKVYKEGFPQGSVFFDGRYNVERAMNEVLKKAKTPHLSDEDLLRYELQKLLPGYALPGDGSFKATANILFPNGISPPVIDTTNAYNAGFRHPDYSDPAKRGVPQLIGRPQSSNASGITHTLMLTSVHSDFSSNDPYAYARSVSSTAETGSPEFSSREHSRRPSLAGSISQTMYGASNQFPGAVPAFNMPGNRLDTQYEEHYWQEFEHNGGQGAN